MIVRAAATLILEDAGRHEESRELLREIVDGIDHLERNEHWLVTMASLSESTVLLREPEIGERLFRLLLPYERLMIAQDNVNYALIVGLADGEAVRTLVDTAVQNSAFRAGIKREEFQGFDVYKITLMMGIFINWTVTDDMAVVSASPSMVQDVLRRKAAGDLPTVAGDEHFKQALSAHSDTYSVITYADAASTFNSQIEQLQAVLTQAFASPFNVPGGVDVPEIVQEIV